jgi:hypothetical protein
MTSNTRNLSNRIVHTSGLLTTFLVAGAILIPGIAAAQTPAAKAPPAQKQSNAKQAVPVTMTECEGTNNCATWTLLGAQGNGQWPSGEIANLAVESSDANSVVIRRADSTGAAAGLTATYTGTRHGEQVGGEFTSSWPGHWDKKSGNWYATVETPVTPPSVMHFCYANCWTLSWDNGHYIASTDNARSIWTVERFTSELVTIHRTDTNGGGGVAFEAVYAGQISKEGDHLANVTINGEKSDFRLAWGTALNTVPGSNAERDRGKPQPAQPVIVARPALCVPWFFTVICG